MSSQSEVETELAKLKAGHAPEAIEAGQDGGDILAGRARDVRPESRSGEPDVIVRILGEGQYDLSDDAVAALNDLDARGRGRRSRRATRTTFRAALAALLDGVRAAGAAHDADSLEPSDLILPMADATLAEVRDMLSGDGLIPG